MEIFGCANNIKGFSGAVSVGRSDLLFQVKRINLPSKPVLLIDFYMKIKLETCDNSRKQN